MEPAALIFMVVFVGFIAGIVWLIFRLNQSYKRTKVAWEELGRRLELEVIPNSDPWWRRRTDFPELRGQRRGRRITLRQEVRGSNKSRVYYYIVEIACERDSRWELQVYPEHIFNRIGKVLGMQDIQVGDTDFDRKFIVKSDKETAAQEALSDSRTRHRLMEMSKYVSSFHLSANKLHHEQVAQILKQEQLEDLRVSVDFLLDLVEQWERIR